MRESTQLLSTPCTLFIRETSGPIKTFQQCRVGIQKMQNPCPKVQNSPSSRKQRWWSSLITPKWRFLQTLIRESGCQTLRTFPFKNVVVFKQFGVHPGHIKDILVDLRDFQSNFKIVWFVVGLLIVAITPYKFRKDFPGFRHFGTFFSYIFIVIGPTAVPAKFGFNSILVS